MDLEYDTLVSAVAAEMPDIDLTGAVLSSGWENVVLETRDSWILRFPRPHVDFAREMAILRRLDGRLPAPIPRVLRVGRRRPFAAYRKLTGHAFDLTAYADAGEAQRDTLAASLAGFLAAVHSALDPGEIRDLGVPPIGNGDQPVLGLHPDIDALVRESRGAPAPGEIVLLHNDFHFSNLVLTGPVGEVAGVWDFSCAATGDPSLDLRYICGDSPELAARIARRYEEATGRRLDVRRATVAHRLEAVADAIELGTTDDLPALVEHWRREDGRVGSPS